MGYWEEPQRRRTSKVCPQAHRVSADETDVMYFCPSNLSLNLLESRFHGLAVLPLPRLLFVFILAMGGAARLEGGGSERSRQPSAGPARPPVAVAVSVPRYQIADEPYLTTVGPIKTRMSPLAGPRVRRAPLLPVTKLVEAKPKPGKAPGYPVSPEVKSHDPSEPSAFSPDAPPILLPAVEPEEKSATTPPVQKESAKESVLVPAPRKDSELRDAVIYFDVPAVPPGSRVIIPSLVPLNSPSPVPQPESRATYRKEKE